MRCWTVSQGIYWSSHQQLQTNSQYLAGCRFAEFGLHLAHHGNEVGPVAKLPHQAFAGTGFRQSQQCAAMHCAEVIGILCACWQAEQETIGRVYCLQADQLVEGDLGNVHSSHPTFPDKARCIRFATSRSLSAELSCKTLITACRSCKLRFWPSLYFACTSSTSMTNPTIMSSNLSE